MKVVKSRRVLSRLVQDELGPGRMLRDEVSHVEDLIVYQQPARFRIIMSCNLLTREASVSRSRHSLSRFRERNSRREHQDSIRGDFRDKRYPLHPRERRGGGFGCEILTSLHRGVRRRRRPQPQRSDEQHDEHDCKQRSHEKEKPRRRGSGGKGGCRGGRHVTGEIVFVHDGGVGERESTTNRDEAERGLRNDEATLLLLLPHPPK